MADGSTFLGQSLRLPPSNLQAEQALLGALLANNRAYERVADFLEPKHFADETHAVIYRQIVERILNGHVADAISLKAEFQNSGLLDVVGGMTYLAQLLSAMVGIINAGEYGKAIVDCWLRRQLIEAGETIVNNAFGSDPSLDARAQVDKAAQMLSDLTSGGRGGDRLVTLGEAVSAAIAQAEAIYKGGGSPALLSGMPTIDRALGGFWPGTLTLLAGVPAAGKTALCTQIGVAIAGLLHDDATRGGVPAERARSLPGVAFFSLEMSAEELGARVAAHRANIGLTALLEGKLDMASAVELARAERELKFLPLRIHDSRAMPLKLLAAKVRMHLQRQPERLVMVDHLLVLGADDDNRRTSGGNDAATVSRAARDLKALASETGLPFVVLTHASRASAQRQSSRPTQSDVKWAGEGDADNVVFVHRPIMFMESSPPPQGPKEGDETYGKRKARWYQEYDAAKNLAEIVVAKRRQGQPGVHRMRWHGATTSFSEWDEAPDSSVPSWVNEPF
jgi:replicative DNA helicase